MREKTVGDLMRHEFVSVRPDETLLEADRIMRLARIRHLPVVQEKLLVGVLSHRDVLDASINCLEDCPAEERTEHLRSVSIERVMRRSPWTVEAWTPLAEAAIRMLRYKIGCLPVIYPGADGSELVGLITESDLLRAAYVPELEESSG